MTETQQKIDCNKRWRPHLQQWTTSTMGPSHKMLGMNLPFLIPRQRRYQRTKTIEKMGTQWKRWRFDLLVRGLYIEAKSSKLAATILLLNLCSVYRVSNCFVDKLFSIFHSHILPQDNSLRQNQYTAKALTRQLGLANNSIHSYKSSCVLFRGEYANETTCPKCAKPIFKDQEQKKFLVKVLRHFFIIPCLQRMFRSPTIS